VRSAWFRNSVRGAAALAIAVLVIEIASVQHAFWVVLATLSVLRSNALGTGATIFSALAGTIAGILVGGLLVYAIGNDQGVLWALLPPAVLLAAYAPRAISFAAGQAGFTMVVLIIFNIIVPTGWTLGLVRVEDVAIGCAISLVVGALFWPRGAESLVRETLASAYGSAANYVQAASQRLAGAPAATDDDLRDRRATARAAATRLDDAFRQFLSEPQGRRANLDSLGTLVTGAVRLRLAAYSMSMLRPVTTDQPLERCDEALISDAGALHSWYREFADGLAGGTALSSPPLRDGPRSSPVVRCVSESIAARPGSGAESALTLLWASQHLDYLWRLGSELLPPATEL
jgi:uncharacterized membrane protein YccC